MKTAGRTSTVQKAEAGEKYRGMAQGRVGSQSAPIESYRSTALEAMYRGSAGRQACGTLME